MYIKKARLVLNDGFVLSCDTLNQHSTPTNKAKFILGKRCLWILGR